MTSVHMLPSSLPFDLAKHPTCCHGAPLRSLGDVRRPGFVGHGDDSERRAVRLLSAHQNKHRKVCCGPPTAPPVQHRPTLAERALETHRSLPSLIQSADRIKGRAQRSQVRFYPADISPGDAEVFLRCTHVLGTFFDKKPSHSALC